MPEVPAELIPPPPTARLYAHHAVAGLSDVAPTGRVRLDALARWLQDAALGDLVDSGLDGAGAWVVRRLRMRVERFPRFGEPIEATTFCSGTGPLCAERRTTLRGHRDALVEAVALWIHLDSDRVHPRPLPDHFHVIYGESARQRRVGPRLRHPSAPPPDATARPWRFRAADLDLADHVNNTAYWQALEEDLVRIDPNTPLDAEIEHRAPADASDATLYSAGSLRWLTGPTGEVLATMSIAPPE